MSPVIDCSTEEGLAEGIAAASDAVRRGEVVVLPTDTVYGVGVDAFAADAVAAVLAAKGRGREMPLPVLIPNADTVDGLAADVPEYARDLMRAFWPGPLTLVLHSQGSLLWDLGETNGTVALRIPQNDVALELLAEVGPMAVTSANLSGQAPATTILEAATQLGSAVSVYLDAGPSGGGHSSGGSAASTILDCTRDTPMILRAGAISPEQLQQILGDLRLGGAELADSQPADARPDDVEPGG
jgi:tRNA threonylcarbamoyl adenosine modification protein (Sua5/YciO/YrdC/YwlC family)